MSGLGTFPDATFSGRAMGLVRTTAPPLMASTVSVPRYWEVAVPILDGPARLRNNLPGPSRRITVEPVETPGPPIDVPDPTPAEPARSPQEEPVGRR